MGQHDPLTYCQLCAEGRGRRLNVRLAPIKFDRFIPRSGNDEKEHNGKQVINVHVHKAMRKD